MSLLSGPLELIWGMAGLMKAVLLDPATPRPEQADRNQTEKTRHP